MKSKIKTLMVGIFIIFPFSYAINKEINKKLKVFPHKKPVTTPTPFLSPSPTPTGQFSDFNPL